MSGSCVRCKADPSIRQAALRFEVSPSAAVKLMRRFRQSGSPAPARFGGHRRSILEPYEALVRGLLASKADMGNSLSRDSTHCEAA